MTARGFTIERMRRWLLLGACATVVVVVGFIGYARYERRKLIRELPKRLGINIQQDTNEFTYSQSVQGRTLFTIHAARAVQMKDNTVKLHDVIIILYGKKQDRADRISGAEFDYDQKNGVARAQGEVHLDLQAPSASVAPAGQTKPGDKMKPDGDYVDPTGKSVIHVITSKLVFIQKLGIASTPEEIEFRCAGISGHARGAEYESDGSLLTLEHAVDLSTLVRGHPVVVTAERAQLNSSSNVAHLVMAKYVSTGQSGSADAATINMRTDGSVQLVDALGKVTLKSVTGGVITAPHMVSELNEQSQPKATDLTGGVHYVDDETERHATGDAQTAHLDFDAKGQMRQATMHENVRVREREKSGATWTEHDLDAAQAVVDFAQNAQGQTAAKDAKATGNARFVTTTEGDPRATKGKQGAEKTTLVADELDAMFAGGGGAANGPMHLTHVHGAGQSSMTQLAADGSVQTSSGDTLELEMAPPTKQKSGKTSTQTAHLGASGIESAVQVGHVVITQTPTPSTKPSQKNADQTVRATASRADYRADTQLLLLSGSPQVSENGMQVAAPQITLSRASGDATASGGVKASYQQNANAVPVHVVADHAELKKAEQRGIFYGSAVKDARMWQDASQVEAPVLDLEQGPQRLTARAAETGAKNGGPVVHTVLVSAANLNPNSKPATTGPQGNVVRVASWLMVYTDKTRQANFSGRVRAENADGTIESQQATVTLQPANQGTSASAGGSTSAAVASTNAAAGMLAGKVQEIVAHGQVVLDQPGRHGTGEQLVYTTKDGNYVLTGTPASPPKITDAVQGTVTGASLLFHAADDSVVVSSEAGVNRQKVRTDTHTKQ